jgi:hypothetical protein
MKVYDVDCTKHGGKYRLKCCSNRFESLSFDFERLRCDERTAWAKAVDKGFEFREVTTGEASDPLHPFPDPSSSE